MDEFTEVRYIIKNTPLKIGYFCKWTITIIDTENFTITFNVRGFVIFLKRYNYVSVF